MSRDLSDESSECALLSLAFANPSELDRKEFMAGLFTDDRRELCKTMLQLRTDGRTVEPGNVRLASKSEELGLLADKLAVRSLGGSFELLFERLRDIRVRVKLAKTCSKYHEQAYDEAQPIRAVIEDFEASAMTVRGVRSNNSQLGSDYGEIVEEIEWRQNNVGKIRGLSTGFMRLDALIDGLKPRYYLLGARTSVGKTSHALNVCDVLLSAKKRVLYFAGEDPKQIKVRLLSIHARVQMGRMDRPYTADELRSINRAITDIQTFDWILDDTPCPSIVYIRSTARRLHRQKPIDLIVIDYVQLCSASHARRDDKRAIVDEVSKGVKGMVSELATAVLVLSQLKRKEGIFDHKSKTTEPAKPELSDLKEAGALEEDADVVMLLHRNQKDASTRAELDVSKNKDGATQCILMTFKPEHYYFSES